MSTVEDDPPPSLPPPSSGIDAASNADEGPRREPAVVTSGHHWLQKVRFSTSLISPLSCGAVYLFAKDVYIIEMGADVPLMGVVGVVLSIVGPCCYPVAGYVLDRDLLARWFPWDTWGRRAPWFLTHSIILAACTAAVYLPPSLDSTFLCCWFLLWGIFSCWTLAVMFTCFEAARAEMYPTKEERSDVESVVKISSGIGTSLGIAPQLIIAAGATLQVRIGASVFFFAVALVSLLSLRVFRLARQAYDPDKVQSFVSEFWSLSKIPACRHFMVYRFVEAVLTTIGLQGALYYLTLVDHMSGSGRSFFIIVTGSVAGLATLLVLPAWTAFFRVRRPNINTNMVAGIVCLIGAPLGPIALGLGRVMPAGGGLVLFCFFLQLTVTGNTFWRCFALGWLVDEDCHACKGRRREAVFVGIITFVSSIGRAIGVGLVINGLGAVGLDFAYCEQECAGDSTCAEACEHRNLEGQPAAVRTYIEVLYYAVMPFCQVLTAILTMTFPIKGARLEAIYRNQAAMFNPTRLEWSVRATHPEPSTDTVDPAEATSPESADASPRRVAEGGASTIVVVSC